MKIARVNRRRAILAPPIDCNFSIDSLADARSSENRRGFGERADLLQREGLAERGFNGSR